MVTHVPALVLCVLVALVAPATPAPAAASPNGCTAYAGCPVTRVSIDAPDKVERGNRATIRVRVSTDGGMEPEGRVRLTVERADGGFTWKDAKKYRGKRVVFRTPALEKRGQYVVTARFIAKPDTIARDADNRDKFRVVRRSDAG